MNWLRVMSLVSLLIYTFGVYIFGAFLLHQLRLGRSANCGQAGASPRASRWVETVGWTVLVVCFFWFVLALAIELSFLAPSFDADWLRLIQIAITYLFPPLIMHVVFADNWQTSADRLRSPWWRIAIGGSYATGLACLLGTLAIVFDLVDVTRQFANIFISASIGGLFGVTSVYAILVSYRTRKREETRSETSARRSMVGLYGFMILICLGILVSHATDNGLGRLVRIVGSSMPLAFIFAGTYFDQRFVFLDVFLKRGLSLLLTVVLLTFYFALLLPRLDGLELDWARPWVWAVLLLPVAMSLPWVFGRLDQWLDAVWLGRRYTVIEAVKSFLARMQRATSAAGLVDEAQRGLGAIFHAAVRIELEPRQAARGPDCVVDVPVRSGERMVGVILMGRRTNQMPYLSQDLELLGSLSDVFSYMLENIRLQEKKLEQEQRAKELSLQASRTELKALRAQINPHFLFNALNVIAGLIHENPERADETVEQLAEVFRYTLRDSEKEWALLEAELDFVRAYLAVEQARFGARLSVRFDVDEQVKQTRIPTMMVQTLVENAVKHGIAPLTGPGRIEIVARREESRLVVEVTDNGKTDPGDGRPHGGPAAVRRKSAGYGLKNVRERLAGHFDGAAELSIVRDASRGVTVARIEMPWDAARGAA